MPPGKPASASSVFAFSTLNEYLNGVQRAVGRLHAVVQESFPRGRVERAVQRLAQFLVFAEKRLVHVDAHVHDLHDWRGKEPHALRGQTWRKLAVLVHHRVPVVAVDAAQGIQLVAEEHQPLRGWIGHDEVLQPVVRRGVPDLRPAAPSRLAREHHPVVAPPFHQTVRTRPDRVLAELRAVRLKRLVRNNAGKGHRHQPREYVKRLRQCNCHSPVVGGLHVRHVVHGPHAAGRIRLVAEAVEREHYVVCVHEASLAAGEAGIVLEANAFPHAKRVDYAVLADCRQLARARNQFVRASNVVNAQRRLVHKLDHAGVRHGRRMDRVHRCDALDRTPVCDRRHRDGKKQKKNG